MEGESIKKCLQPSDYIVLLDDKGKQLTSKDFAKYIENKMTLTHQMVRLLFAEQIYRAMTILNNDPYHHE